LYLLTYRGVLCPQARDLFTAGSVAMRADQTRGGNYMLRSLQDIEVEMRIAAQELEDALFAEYWGFNVAPEQRIRKWLDSQITMQQIGSPRKSYSNVSQTAATLVNRHFRYPIHQSSDKERRRQMIIHYG